MRIERYTKGIVRQRAVADLVDPSAIQTAGSGFKAAAKALTMGAEMADRWVAAKETVAVNDAIIRSKKQKLDLLEQSRKQNLANPDGFAKRFEPDLEQLDQSFLDSLPTQRAKDAYSSRMQQVNLGIFEDNFKWSHQRQAEIMADTLENDTTLLASQAIDAANKGLPLDDILRDGQATIVAANNTGLVKPENQDNVRRNVNSTIKKSYLATLIDNDPKKALELVKDEKFSADLDPSARVTLQRQADNELKRIEAKAEAEEVKRLLKQQSVVSDIYKGNGWSAAQKSLELEGVENPTPFDYFQKQVDLGVAEYDIEVANPDLVEAIGRDLANASSVEEYKATYQGFLDSFPNQQMKAIAEQNLIKNGNVPEQVKLIIQNNPRNKAGDVLYNALFSAAIDEKSIDTARQTLRGIKAKDANSLRDVEEVIATNIANINRADMMQGVSPQAANTRSKMMNDAAIIAVAREATVSGKPPTKDFINQMFDGLGDYDYDLGVPLKHDVANVVSERDLQRAVGDVLDNKEIMTRIISFENNTSSFQTKQQNPKLHDEYLKRLKELSTLSYGGKIGTEDFYWVKDSGGNNHVYELKEVDGQMVREPIFVTERDLLEAAKKRRETTVPVKSIREGF